MPRRGDAGHLATPNAASRRAGNQHLNNPIMEQEPEARAGASGHNSPVWVTSLALDIHGRGLLWGRWRARVPCRPLLRGGQQLPNPGGNSSAGLSFARGSAGGLSQGPSLVLTFVRVVFGQGAAGSPFLLGSVTQARALGAWVPSAPDSSAAFAYTNRSLLLSNHRSQPGRGHGLSCPSKGLCTGEGARLCGLHTDPRADCSWGPAGAKHAAFVETGAGRNLPAALSLAEPRVQGFFPLHPESQVPALNPSQATARLRRSQLHPSPSPLPAAHAHGQEPRPASRHRRKGRKPQAIHSFIVPVEGYSHPARRPCPSPWHCCQARGACTGALTLSRREVPVQCETR